MSSKLKTKKIERPAPPLIHIRVKKNVTYFVEDGIRIAVTKSQVVNKRKKDTNKELV